MILVQCPKCRHTMKTAPKVVSSAVKKCVYCNHAFKIRTEDGLRIPAQIPAVDGFPELRAARIRDSYNA